MDNIYDYFRACEEQGMSGQEAMNQYQRDLAEFEAQRLEELEERSERTTWQQDLIDLHRFER